ncbi:MAG TPA: hypothetical protein VF545_05840 [Thermoleophilaceae bacterium]|jgi:hypothetical protein
MPARVVAAVAAVLVLAVAAVPAPAGAAKRKELALQDEGVFLNRAYYDRERALSQARALGVTRIRANVIWRTANDSQQEQKQRPAAIVYDWSAWDSLIDAAARYGIRVQLTLTGPAPAYATADHRPGVFGPSAGQFGSFVRAAVRHFKGRVNRYSMWNEPSLSAWLAPFDLAPALYRELYLAGYRAAKSEDRSAKVLFGELLPYRRLKSEFAPLRFLRDVTCTTQIKAGTRRKPPRLLRGPCKGLRADGIAHHPYDYFRSPSAENPDPDGATISGLWRLTGMLKALAKNRALSTPSGKPPGVYLTEFGYFHSGAYRLSDAKRAVYLPRAYSIAQRYPTVREITHYTLVTPPYGLLGSYFDLGIVDLSGNPLPPYNALAAWAADGIAKGRVVAPGGPIKLPPAPAS